MKQLGDTQTIKKVQKRFRITAAKEKFLNGCQVIHDAPLEGERAFMARQLVQCTLPHSNPGDDKPAWVRRNGNRGLVIQAGWDLKKNCSTGYPYGTLPRLLLFWIISEVLRDKERRVRENNRRIELGDNLSSFMRDLGLIPASAGGGKRSDSTRLKDQMRRLFNCRITFQGFEESADEEGEGKFSMDVAPKYELWWSTKQPEQSALWGSWIELGEGFFQSVLESPVPVDMRALRLLKGSALCLDLYCWCVWKAFEARRTGQKQSISWKALMQQLGCSYEGLAAVKDFKKEIRAALRKVSSAYPGLRTARLEGGFSVLPGSGLAILPKGAR